MELARKRGWKGYWVCLKGTTLLFYPCESKEGQSVEATPRHLIIVDGSIMQAIPEHPKRDFIFCLSTAFGDAYLFQVSIYMLHSGKFAKKRHRIYFFAKTYKYHEFKLYIFLVLQNYRISRSVGPSREYFFS